MRDDGIFQDLSESICSRKVVSCCICTQKNVFIYIISLLECNTEGSEVIQTRFIVQGLFSVNDSVVVGLCACNALTSVDKKESCIVISMKFNAQHLLYKYYQV